MPIGIRKHAVQIIDKTDTFAIIWINDVVVNAKIIKNRTKRESVLTAQNLDAQPIAQCFVVAQ